MADPVIKIKRSAVAGKIPTPDQLPLGEVALNTYDGYLYASKNVGIGTTIFVINPFRVGTGTDSYNAYFTAGNIGIGSTLPTEALTVAGVVSATSFYGDGSNLTGISAGGGSQWVSTDVGIHTLSSVGIGTTNPNASVTSANTGVLAAGIVTAYKFYGDGTGITGINAVARVSVSQTPPTSPSEGDLWYHTTQARLFIYYTDIDSSQWIDAAPFNGGSGGGTSVSIGATSPNGPLVGDLWYNSDYGRLFVYYGDVDSEQWVDAAPFNFPANNEPTKTETSFTATAGQTTFTVSYEVGFVEVYLNGIRLSSSEFNASSGVSIILSDPATEGDIVDVIEIATGRGATGARGPAGATTLAGIGTTSVSTTHYPVFVSGLGNTTPLISTTSNYFGFIPESGTLTTNQLVIAGVATATDFNSSSDINLKKDVKVIDDPVAKVLQLNGVSFSWTDTGQSSAGVIAQDVEKVMPEIIRDNSTGYKSLNYNGLIGLLIEAVKEQNETIKSLEQKINTLEERLS